MSRSHNEGGDQGARRRCRARRRAHDRSGLSRNYADGLGSAGVLARSLRRPAEGISVLRSFTKSWAILSPRPVGGTPTGSDRDGRGPHFQLHRSG
jgi:hypothetical protein